MLDDLKYIHERDAQDALGVAEKQWQQLSHDFGQLELPNDFTNIVFSGMGGSALSALIGAKWPGYTLPLEVVRQYHIPKYVSDKTLFIASSYSGNTEETLSCLTEAENQRAQIVVIAGGGQLIDVAKAKNYPHLILPQVGQPRFATFYSLRALITVLVAAGLQDAAALAEMTQAAAWLQEQMSQWLPTIPSDKNPTKQVALELMGKSIVIYAGPLLAPAAYKWKISFNENAKNLAWWNEYSEWNHNELSGWLSHPTQKPYSVVELRSQREHERIQKRFVVIERLLSGTRPAPEVVEAQGQTDLEQLVWTISFGDFVSLYLALLNGLNPSPVEMQEKLKKSLDE